MISFSMFTVHSYTKLPNFMLLFETVFVFYDKKAKKTIYERITVEPRATFLIETHHEL